MLTKPKYSLARNANFISNLPRVLPLCFFDFFVTTLAGKILAAFQFFN